MEKKYYDDTHIHTKKSWTLQIAKRKRKKTIIKKNTLNTSILILANLKLRQKSKWETWKTKKKKFKKKQVIVLLSYYYVSNV